MGGIIGMLLAAETNTPIRRLVINDVGPFIPLMALKRIGAYAGRQRILPIPEKSKTICARFMQPSADSRTKTGGIWPRTARAR